MLGVSLLYVGAVLTINGIGRLTEIDGKSLAVMNFFTGGLSVIANVILLVCGEYYAAATGLLFGFTYLFIGLNAVFNLDGRVLGWFSLFVAIKQLSRPVPAICSLVLPLPLCSLCCRMRIPCSLSSGWHGGSCGCSSSWKVS